MRLQRVPRRLPLRGGTHWLAAVGVFVFGAALVVTPSYARGKSDSKPKPGAGKSDKESKSSDGTKAKSSSRHRGCPKEMVLVDASKGPATARFHGRVCIDKWEASLVEKKGGAWVAFSPYENPAGKTVKAVSRAGVVPQAYVSKNDAEAACQAAGKRLCAEAEWVTACEGKKGTTFPYGNDRKDAVCNDNGKAPLATLYPKLSGPDLYGAQTMNDPRLNQQPGTVSKTGRHGKCKSSFGAYDLVGNLHEWVDDPNGTFRGGYYLDTAQNGDGCHYRTDAHDVAYHDYSTGFRCCKDG